MSIVRNVLFVGLFDIVMEFIQYHEMVLLCKKGNEEKKK